MYGRAADGIFLDKFNAFSLASKPECLLGRSAQQLMSPSPRLDRPGVRPLSGHVADYSLTPDTCTLNISVYFYYRTRIIQHFAPAESLQAHPS